jgi:DNA-binding NarL/FixJ family response regulator
MVRSIRTTKPALASPAAHSHEAGRGALARGAWDEARTHLQACIAAEETPEALEDLGLAAWWLDDATLIFDARERAYALYRARHDARGAARVAIWLVWDCLSFRGDFAVASGWLERARHLLADDQQTPEYGWLLVREGEVALFRGHDPAAAIEIAARAAKLGRDVGDQSVEFTALALEGLARVSRGDVIGGMRRLDEATIAATAGEMKELHAVGVVCCWQIFACERMRDYDRAAQWCARVQEFTRRWGLRPLSGLCRAQYANVLIWRGEWESAEAELMLAARELARVRPATVAPALARLGELRLRQGRLDEASRLFEQASPHPQARLGLATLLLERGNADECVALLDRFLAQQGGTEATARTGALELLVRAHAARGDSAAASHSFAELQGIASALGTDPLAASVAATHGVLLRQRGDLEDAANCFESAIDLFIRCGAPFEVAKCRLDLAGIHAATGRLDAAERDALLAMKTLDGLGARHEGERGRRLLHDLRAATPKHGHGRASLLTERQVEILRLVALGLSNGEIAARLHLSEHTVKRHLANLLTKLGLSSRAAAVAYAAREGLL